MKKKIQDFIENLRSADLELKHDPNPDLPTGYYVYFDNRLVEWCVGYLEAFSVAYGIKVVRERLIEELSNIIR